MSTPKTAEEARECIAEVLERKRELGPRQLSNVDLAEKLLLYQFRCFVTKIQPAEREHFFHPINRSVWVNEFCNWAHEDTASND